MSAIETYTGAYFDYCNPRAEDVNLDDIARALSLQCRFGGHVSQFYSVAEHACLVYRLVRQAGATPEVCYAALHHDSHEAYLGDVPTPLKRTFGPEWQRLVEQVDHSIDGALGVNYLLMQHPAVKEADHDALLIEAAELKQSRGVGEHWGNDAPARSAFPVLFWTPRQAEEAFIYFHRCARSDLPVVGLRP